MISPPNIKTSGPRTRVTLDVSEIGLQELIEGWPAHTIWLEPAGEENVYTLRASERIGDARKRDEPVLADVLWSCMNDLVESINEHIDDVPPPVLATLDAALERYEARNREGRG